VQKKYIYIFEEYMHQIYFSYLPDWYTMDVQYYNSSDHSAAGTHQWCDSLKLTVTNNIQVVYKHVLLTMSSILKDFITKGDS
jgi:hypothetical protein